MSKIFKDFINRRKTPAGDLIQLQQSRVRSNWANFEHCIKNNLPIYVDANTQSGKTFFKFWLADEAMNTGLVDNVIISTTNLTGAMNQIQARAISWAQEYGRQVKSTTDKSAYMVRGDIFINMTNANRTNRIDSIVADAEKTAKKYNRPLPKILVIIDEGEEFHQSTRTSNCDRALGNLLIHHKHNISEVKISATLLSHLMIHGQFTPDLGFLTKEQIYRIPNHPDYIGLNKKDFIEPVLVPENNWNGKGYVSAANLKNTYNIKIVVDQIETLISNQKRIGDDKKTKSLVQIGNIVFGNSCGGHLKSADMLSNAFQRQGRTVTLWDNEDFDQLNTSTEIAVIVHNGNARDLSVAQKLKYIAHGWDRKELKAIVIISKMMTGKSISIECDNWADETSPEFGFYANFTAYYGPGRENITMAIQAMRCTGIRPAIKKNVMWATDETKQDIENYRDQMTKFISHLNSVGVLTQTHIQEWILGTRPFAKSAVQKKYINTASNTKKFSGKSLSAKDYKDLLSQGVSQLDGHYTIPKRTYDALNKLPNRDLASKLFDYIKSKGFNDLTFGKTGLRSRRHANYKDGSSAQQAFTRGDDLQHHDSLINMHLYENNGKYFVYAFNNMRPADRPMEYLKMDIEFSNSFQPSKFTPKLFHKTDSYVYPVTP